MRLTRANSSSIGAALGSIIATIITHHMENISTAYAGGPHRRLHHPAVHAGHRVISMALMSMPAPSSSQPQAMARTATSARDQHQPVAPQHRFQQARFRADLG